MTEQTTAGEPERPTYVIASTYMHARLYCQAVDAPRSWRLAIEAERLRALGPGALVIVVDTGQHLREGVADLLVILEYQGTEVRWVNLDKVMGVDRDGRS